MYERGCMGERMLVREGVCMSECERANVCIYESVFKVCVFVCVCVCVCGCVCA